MTYFIIVIISVYTYKDYCYGVTLALHSANEPSDVHTVSKIIEILLRKSTTLQDYISLKND